MEILKDYSEVVEARIKMKAEKISFIDNRIIKLLRRFKLINNIEIGDLNKSWDILHFINFVKNNVKKNESILDIGCYKSEFIISLNALSYNNLSGIDLNQDITRMPANKNINYLLGNFMNFDFKEKTFKVISAISVIEHGFDKNRFLESMSRIMQNDGYLLISFDYWPDKIDTSKTKLFNMEWNIFSKSEVQDLITTAKKYNLLPINELNYSASKKAITHVGYDYTFGLIIFKKNNDYQ